MTITIKEIEKKHRRDKVTDCQRQSFYAYSDEPTKTYQKPALNAVHKIVSMRKVEDCLDERKRIAALNWFN